MSCSPSKPPTTLKEMWAELHWWSFKNFPNETLSDTLDHIGKELSEAIEAQNARLNQGRTDNDTRKNLDDALSEELADIMILAGKMMGNLGYDPETEILRKWEEVRERTYKDGKRI
jgi:NTP pyrophosphatase (non-canonical NTP hydrolase)